MQEFQGNGEQINVVEYLNVVFRGKKTIFWCLVFGLIIFCLIYFYKTGFDAPLQNTYRALATVEVGKIQRQYTEGSIEKPVEKIDNVILKINQGVFNKGLPIKASVIKSANFVSNINLNENANVIELSTEFSDKNFAKNSLSDSVEAILLYHQGLINEEKEKITNRINLLQESVKRLSASGQETAVLELEILHLKGGLDDTHSSKLIKEPAVSVFKSSFNKIAELIFILIVGAVAGLFLGLFIVFFREWWNKNKSYINI